MLAILPIIEMLLAFAGDVPELVAAGKTVVDLLRSGQEPTPEQMASFDLALEAANAALQKA
jgi:hypothetical protein